MSNQLFDRYFISAAMGAVFSDTGRVQGMLDFEAALARAEARVGLIPHGAVAAIEAACRAERYDFAELAEGIVLAGHSAIPLVKALGRQGAAAAPHADREGLPPRSRPPRRAKAGRRGFRHGPGPPRNRACPGPARCRKTPPPWRR